MAVLTEGRHPVEFIMSEAPRMRSRDAITIASGAGVVQPGTVLGLAPSGTATAAAKTGGNTGNGTITMDATNPVLGGAMAGVYTVRFTEAASDGGLYEVQDPNGVSLGTAAVGATWADQVKFVIADGATDFVVGDGFDITVAIAGRKYVPAPHTSADGSHIGVAMNLYEVDATSADVDVTAITRDAEINTNMVVYEATVDDAAKKAVKLDQLRSVGIIAR